MGQSWYISINIYWHTGRLIGLHVHTCCCQPTVLLCWTLSSPYSFCGLYCRSSIKTSPPPPPPFFFFFFYRAIPWNPSRSPITRSCSPTGPITEFANRVCECEPIRSPKFDTVCSVGDQLVSSWALPIYTVNTPNRSIAHHWLDCLGDCSHSRGHGTAKLWGSVS